MDNQNVPGKGAATGALVLGIVGLVVALFINGPIGLVACIACTASIGILSAL